MKINIDKKLLRHFFIFLLFFTLTTTLLAFTFYDLQAANKLYVGDNVFSNLFAYIGKLPAYILLIFSCIVLSRTVNVDYSSAASALKWLYRILALLSSVLFFYSIFENFMQNKLTLLLSSLGSGIALAAAAVITGEFVKREKFILLEKWALVTVILVLVTIGAALVLKVAVGRLRFIDIINDQEKYLEWYKIDFFGGGDSFPSGHVALASTLILIPLLLKTLHAKLPVKICSDLVCFAFVALTLYSRLSSGHHYMTDVFTSVTMVLMFYFILKSIFYRDSNLFFTGTTKAEKALRLGIKNSSHQKQETISTATPAEK